MRKAFQLSAGSATTRGVRRSPAQAADQLGSCAHGEHARAHPEIARNGVPVARLVAIDRSKRPGERFIAARGSLADRIWISEQFELTDAEIDELLADAPP